MEQVINKAEGQVPVSLQPNKTRHELPDKSVHNIPGNVAWDNPGECSFDDPALGQDDEAMEIGTLDDLDLPTSRRGNSLRHFGTLIAAVSEMRWTKGKRRRAWRSKSCAPSRS